MAAVIPWWPGLAVCWVSDPQQRQDILQGRSWAVVSSQSELRANLTVTENVAWIPMFRDGMAREQALALALDWLNRLDVASIASQRPAELSSQDRFVAMVAQLLISEMVTEWAIDRPGLLLPDTHITLFLPRLMAKLPARCQHCTIVDYVWNAPLYPMPDPTCRPIPR